jgi:hypothetical protein
MRLADWLTRKKVLSLWIVKQVDEGLLHVCGKGSVAAKGNANKTLQQLRNGEFRGPVRMGGNDAVLNSAQFAVLIPEEDFQLDSDNHATWRDCHWKIAWVPQRCWLHEGRLVSQPIDYQGQPRRISVEDTSGIRAKVESPRAKSEFIPIEPLGHASPQWQRADKDNDPYQS